MVPKRVFQKDRFGRTVVVDAGTRGIAEVEAKARPHMGTLIARRREYCATGPGRKVRSGERTARR